MDMLVKLYDLDELVLSETNLKDSKSVEFRKPYGYEYNEVLDWIEVNFNIRWKSEASRALTQLVPSVHLAFVNNEMAGFACFNATALGMFGPMGVSSQYRNIGIGKQLLLRSLLDMRNAGYAYAVIGGVAATEFYKKIVNATEISNSEPGLYTRINSD